MKKVVLLLSSKSQTIAAQKALVSQENIRVVNTGGQILELNKQDPLTISEQDGSFEENWKYREGKENLIEYLLGFKHKGYDFVLASDGSIQQEKIAFDLSTLGLGKFIRVGVISSLLMKDILECIHLAREVDESMALAERVRQIVDILIGYRLTNVMKWHLTKEGYAVPSHIGLGRIMSFGLKLLCDNQREIKAHVSEAFVRLKCWYVKEGEHFEFLDKTRFFTDSYEHILQKKELFNKLVAGPHVVTNYMRKQREESPPPPLTLSALDIAAFNTFRYNSGNTSSVAEALYLQGYITNYKTSNPIIHPDIFSEMIEYLYQTIEEDDVVDIQRHWKGESLKEEWAITPTRFSQAYSPEKIKEVWKHEGLDFGKKHHNLYKLIWYRTLATQVENAFLDATELTLQVDNHKMKIIGNKMLIEEDDEGNKRERSGWLGLSNPLLRNSITISEDGYRVEDIVVPYHDIGEEATCVDVTEFSSGTQPPRHYGEGRFVKTLERMRIAKTSALAMLSNKMIRYSYVEHKGIVLVVRALGMRVNKWVEEHASFLVEIENVIETTETLKRIESGDDVDFEKLIYTILAQIQEVEKSVGYLERDRASDRPTYVQQEMARKIAIEKQLVLGEEIFSNLEMMEVFLRKHESLEDVEEVHIDTQPLLEGIGICPACKSGKIIRREKFYGCSHYKKGCKFTLNIEFTLGFFNRFGKSDVDLDFLDKMLCIIFSKGYFEVLGLVTREGKVFDAKLSLEEKNGYWNLTFFKKKNGTV